MLHNVCTAKEHCERMRSSAGQHCKRTPRNSGEAESAFALGGTVHTLIVLGGAQWRHCCQACFAWSHWTSIRYARLILFHGRAMFVTSQFAETLSLLQGRWLLSAHVRTFRSWDRRSLRDKQLVRGTRNRIRTRNSKSRKTNSSQIFMWLKAHWLIWTAQWKSTASLFSLETVEVEATGNITQ